MSGRIAATFPFPAAARDLNCFMKLKLLVNELVETLEGPLARTEAEAPPPPTPTSVADNSEGEPPEHACPAETHIVSFVLVRPVGRAPCYCRSTRMWRVVLRFCCNFENHTEISA